LADRVKTSLLEGALKQVLTVEGKAADKRSRSRQWSDVRDMYYANYRVNDKPHASAIGVHMHRAQTISNDVRSILKQGRGNSPSVGDFVLSMVQRPSAQSRLYRRRSVGENTSNPSGAANEGTGKVRAPCGAALLKVTKVIRQNAV
jgi:hypothetical protein